MYLSTLYYRHNAHFSSLQLAVLFLMALGCCLALLPTPLSAHEIWLLTPLQVADIATKPVPSLFSSVHWLTVLLSLATAGALLVAGLIDLKLAPVENKLTRYFIGNGYAPLVLACRLGLAILLLTAAYGLAPRHGTPYLSQATLFVADLELSRINPMWPDMLQAVQIMLGVLLLFGVFLRLAALGVIALVIVGYGLFGGDMNPYLGHILAPTLLVFFLANSYRGRTPYLDAPRGEWVPAHHLLVAFRVVMGLSFVYLSLAFKVQQPNMILAILGTGTIPTLGLPHDVVAMIMAIVELAVGVMIAVGVGVRLASVLAVGAMVFFMITLKEGPHIHANIIGGIVALLFMGDGRLGRPAALTQLVRTLPAHVKGMMPPAFAALTFAVAGLWLPAICRLNPDALPSSIFVRMKGAAPSVDYALIRAANGHTYLEIQAKNFNFMNICGEAPSGSAEGHAHVYIDGRKITAYTPRVDLGALGPEQHTITVALTATDHRFIFANNQMVMASNSHWLPASDLRLSQL